ncbi:MAG: CSLREA domain-containing protein [Deltaproteobacteria bacterium]|nr:CSLREA domain-containing protein [Deltaproteobacteria bacterium]
MRNRTHSLAIAAFVAITGGAATAAATTITVDSTADDLGAGPNGNCTLREALRAANFNVAVDACPAGTPGAVAFDSIVVPAGNYLLTAGGRYEDLGLTGDLDVLDNVQIDGAGAATTVIDAGDIDRVMHLRGATIGISKLTLTGGTAVLHEPEAGESQTPMGGGVMVEQNADVTFTDVTIRDNTALNGGAIQNLGGHVHLVRSTLSGNFAALDLTFLNFESGFSGGIGNDGPTAVVSVTDSTITQNTAQLGGAGVSNAFFGLGGSMTITGSTISANTALGAAASGFPWPPTGGGAGILNDGPLTIENSTISGNVANSFTVPSSGGGIITGGDTSGAVLVMINSTVAANQAASGTALLVNTGSITLSNTLVQGSCRFLGSGVMNSQGGNLESPANGCGFGAGTDLVSVADPKLGALAANGGPTPTHALLTGSPAIDKGLGAGCPAVDQRGTARPQPAGGKCDTGAYELVPSTGCGAGSPAVMLLPLAMVLGGRRKSRG